MRKRRSDRQNGLGPDGRGDNQHWGSMEPNSCDRTYPSCAQTTHQEHRLNQDRVGGSSPFQIRACGLQTWHFQPLRLDLTPRFPPAGSKNRCLVARIAWEMAFEFPILEPDRQNHNPTVCIIRDPRAIEYAMHYRRKSETRTI